MLSHYQSHSCFGISLRRFRHRVSSGFLGPDYHPDLEPNFQRTRPLFAAGWGLYQTSSTGQPPFASHTKLFFGALCSVCVNLRSSLGSPEIRCCPANPALSTARPDHFQPQGPVPIGPRTILAQKQPSSIRNKIIPFVRDHA